MRNRGHVRQRGAAVSSHRPWVPLLGILTLLLAGCGEAAASSGSPTVEPSASRSVEAPVPAPPSATSTQAPATPAPMNASVPVRLMVPAIGVDTELMALGLNADGTLEVPPAGFPAGWYTGAPTPGEPGPAVIAGHIDWTDGPGVFYDLDRLQAGDAITVVRTDGIVVTFVVVGVEAYPKDQFPTEKVYGDTTDPQLRLITCGGSFNRGTGHYVDNLVVYATMAGASPAGPAEAAAPAAPAAP